MINFLILIMVSLALVLSGPGCTESGNQGGGTAVEGDLSETEAAEGDILKKMQDEGKLPPSMEGRRLPVLPSDGEVLRGSGPEVLSLYPVEIDTDQDEYPDDPIEGRPEVKTDNCPGLFNPDQADANGDGIGDFFA